MNYLKKYFDKYLKTVKKNGVWDDADDCCFKIFIYFMTFSMIATVLIATIVNISNLTITKLLISIVLISFTLLSTLLIFHNYVKLYYRNIVVFMFMYAIGFVICVPILEFNNIESLSLVTIIYMTVCGSSIFVPIIEYIFKAQKIIIKSKKKEVKKFDIEYELSEIKNKLIELDKL